MTQAQRRFEDPAFDGIKVVMAARDDWVLKCKARCNGQDVRPKARVTSLEEAHSWAVEHRRKFPEHDQSWARL